MHVVLVAGSPMYYQAPVYRAMTDILARRGDTATFVFMSDGGIRAAPAGYLEPTSWDVPILGGFHARFLRRAPKTGIEGGTDLDILRVLREERPDVLVTHGYNSVTHLMAVLWAAVHGVPRVLREEQTLLHPRPRWKTFLKRAHFRLLWNGQWAVYIGWNNREWLRSFGFARDRLVHSPYCVDNARFATTADNNERTAERSVWGFEESDLVVATVCRLVPKKQPEHLIDAFAMAATHNERLRLLIAGDGELLDRCRKRVTEQQLAEKTRFAGFVPQSRIGVVYRAADMFVLASLENETWGLVVNEAMASGLPCIVTDAVGCANDLIVSTGAGVVVPTSDTRALADAIAQLANDADKRMTAAAQARLTIEAYTPQSAAEGLTRACYQATAT